MDKQKLNCPLAGALEIIGPKWTLLILKELAIHGARRHQDLMESLQVCPTTLSGRLKKLDQAGVVKKEIYCQHPPRANYQLTPMGEELVPALQNLIAWGMRHCTPEDSDFRKDEELNNFLNMKSQLKRD